MQNYAAYIKTLDAVLENTEWGRHPVGLKILHQHLNGGASTALRNLVTRQDLRQSGAFFTGESLGRRMLQLVSPVSNDASAWDPTCGAGDLLLRWSERLPVLDNDLEETLAHWSSKLYGVELHEEFVQVAKRRLAMAAVSRGAKIKRGKLNGLDEFFQGIECRDLLERDCSVPKEAVILMNPPFTMIPTPKNCREWSSGRVAFAAVAFLNCLEAATEGQQILAVLPDVLRSGSRYNRWRQLVADRAQSAKTHLVGKFDQYADVDVFILHAVASKSQTTEIGWFPTSAKVTEPVLNDLCEIRVGTVVPYRHSHTGKKVAYLTPAGAPAWGEIHSVPDAIHHSGRCVSGPFLAVRRTSGPADKFRAVSTLVNVKEEIAVENHLISLRPYDGRVETCRQILEYLRSDKMRQWFDERIRCRHLTVSCLREVPTKI